MRRSKERVNQAIEMLRIALTDEDEETTMPMAEEHASAAAAMDLAGEILAGRFDAYLELLINAGHNRKRALRGTPGFLR